jgi:hypothetical protein
MFGYNHDDAIDPFLIFAPGVCNNMATMKCTMDSEISTDKNHEMDMVKNARGCSSRAPPSSQPSHNDPNSSYMRPI